MYRIVTVGAVLLLALSGASAQDDAQVSGLIYNDLDRDGTLDPEDGIVDVGEDGITLTIACIGFPSGVDFLSSLESDPPTGAFDVTVSFIVGDESASCVLAIDPLSQLDPLLEATTPVELAFSLSPGAVVDDLAFGLSFRDIFLGDLVWLDLDSDGTAEGGEDGIASVTVDAVCTDAIGDRMEASADTDADGNYLISMPCVTPARMDCTVSIDPTQLGLDGKPPTTPISYEFMALAPGDTVDTADFGFFSDAAAGEATVSGIIFVDDDVDGTLDVGESGPEGNGVELDCTYSGGGTLFVSELTDDTGAYLATVPIPEGESASCEYEAMSLVTEFVVPTTPTNYSLTLVSGDAVNIDVGFARMLEFPLGNFTTRSQEYFGETQFGADVLLQLLEDGAIDGFGDVLDLINQVFGRAFTSPLAASRFVWRVFPDVSLESDVALLVLNLGMDSIPDTLKTLLPEYAINVDRVPHTEPIYPPSTANSQALDQGSVLMSDMLTAGLDLLASGGATVELGGTQITREEYQEILRLVNSSYDGEASGYVSRYDYDDPNE